MEYVTNSIFSHADVELDGHHYTNCSFDNCRIIFLGREPFVLESNSFVRCGFMLADQAAFVADGLRVLASAGGNMQGIVAQMVGLGIAEPPGSSPDQMEHRPVSRVGPT